jgi:hypothetical protein
MRPTTKITAVAVLFIFSTLTINAQTRTSALKKIYGQLGTGPATNSGYSGSFGVQSVWKNNLVATVSYQNISANPKNLPSDYQRGYTYFILLPIPDAMPEQDLNIISITMGKLFPSGRKAWFTTEAGLSLVKGDKFTFSRQGVESGSLIFVGYSSSNYSASKESTTSIGGQFKADFNWAFCSFAGLGAGVYANLNSIQSVVGGEIKISIGWMNRGPKTK